MVGCKILLAASKGLPFLHSSHVTIVDVRRHFGILVFYSAECDCKALDDVRCRISCLRLDAVKRDVTWLVVARALKCARYRGAAIRDSLDVGLEAGVLLPLPFENIKMPN